MALTLTGNVVVEQDPVDLDPTSEELLPVWGHEVSAKNLERYIPAIGDTGMKNKDPKGAWGISNDAALLEESLHSTFNFVWREEH